jgi:hypothetical protein
VFVGTVLDVDAHGGSPGEGRRSTVRVLDMVGAPTLLGDLRGADVTAVVPDELRVEAGRTYVFDTVGVSYGLEVVVRVLSIEPDVAAGRARHGAVDLQLSDQIGDATAIVVADLLRLDEPAPPDRITEHDPGLAPARLRVVERLAGITARDLDVLVPTSDDVVWWVATAPRVGEQAVFFLRPFGAGAEGDRPLMVIAVRPVGDAERVRSAIAGG